MQDTEKVIRARISTLEAALAQTQQQYQQAQANVFMLQGALAEKKCDLDALTAPVVGQVTQEQLSDAIGKPPIVDDCPAPAVEGVKA